MAERLLVGRILKPIGLNGLVKLQSYMSTPEVFVKQTVFYSSAGNEIRVTNLRHISDDKFSGFINGLNNCDDASKYRMVELYLPRSMLLPLSKNEYYIDDLKGLSVYDENGILLGKVRIALNYGAGTFLEVLISSEVSTHSGKIATVPFNKYAIIDVNLSSNTIIINKNYLLY